jgi:V/A-type H+-transporting ATPase subunit D
MTTRRHGRAAPTHHELVEVQWQLRIAQKGEHVLERRRDGLVFALLDLLDRWRAVRERADGEYRWAARLHALGAAREGDIALRALAEARATRPELLLDETKLFGLRVPIFLSRNVSTWFEEQGYGVVGTSALDDELAAAYESLLESVVTLAELRAVLAVVLAGVRRLRIRVNYLTHRLIPELESERRYIRRYLEEREQEEHYRYLWLKRRREERRDA